jgi:pyruvate kinase
MPSMSEPAPFTRTKIVGTLGPATADRDALQHLVEEGLRVVRLNFSHGTLDEHTRHVQLIRDLAQHLDRPLAILGDLAGPKIRLVGVGEDGFDVAPGDRVVFAESLDQAHRTDDGAALMLAANYPSLVREVQPGHRVLIDDGHIRLLAIAQEPAESQASDASPTLVCRVTQGGCIAPRKGVNLPDTHLSLPSVTDYDWQCVQWAIEQELDYLALSFVRSERDIEALRAGVKRISGDPGPGVGRLSMPIIAKIETPTALNNLEPIIDAADAVMVARGDLGVELDPWEVPIIQKRALRSAHDAGKPVIVATQMLHSMTEHGSATRAEVSDIANAVIDGADALMLSGETAVGEHPTAAVRVMRQTAQSAEQFTAADTARQAGPPRKLQVSRYRTAALAHGVSVVVRDLDARYAIVWSERGGGARYLSQNRLAVPILAASANPAALRRMSLMFGVEPIAMDRPREAGDFLDAIDRLLLARQWAEPGDPVVVVLGEPLGTAGVTNELRIHYVGDVCRLDTAPTAR